MRVLYAITLFIMFESCYCHFNAMTCCLKQKKNFFYYIFTVKCWYMKINQVFRVKKNVQIFSSTGILQWKGGAHRPRIEWRSTNERRECWKVFTVYWHHCCSSFSPSCRLVAHLPAQVQLQPVLLAQSGLKGTVDTRGSLSQGTTVQNDEA